VSRSPYVVNDLSAIKLPWLAGMRLRMIRKRPRTGLLLHGIIRTSARSASGWAPVISVREGDRRLCLCSAESKLPKWVPLEPGSHDLHFFAGRMRFTYSSFDATVVLEAGDVLVAIGNPIQSRLIFTKRLTADHWYLGVIRLDPHQ
jgi:hypothetical protein